MLHWLLKESPPSVSVQMPEVTCGKEGWKWVSPPRNGRSPCLPPQGAPPGSASISPRWWDSRLIFSLLSLQHLPLMSLFSRCLNNLKLSHRGNSQIPSLKHVIPFQLFRGACPGAGTDPPCQSSLWWGSPPAQLRRVPVLLSACLASFWGAFVLLFHLRKDTLVTNQSSAC